MLVNVRVVCDTEPTLLFIARVELSEIRFIKYDDKLRKWTDTIVSVPEGTGNEGSRLQYQCTYDGFVIDYSDFVSYFNKVNV